MLLLKCTIEISIGDALCCWGLMAVYVGRNCLIACHRLLCVRLCTFSVYIKSSGPPLLGTVLRFHLFAVPASSLDCCVPCNL